MILLVGQLSRYRLWQHGASPPPIDGEKMFIEFLVCQARLLVGSIPSRNFVGVIFVCSSNQGIRLKITQGINLKPKVG